MFACAFASLAGFNKCCSSEFDNAHVGACAKGAVLDFAKRVDPDLAAYIIVRAFHGVVHSTTLYAPEQLRDGALWDELRTLVLGYLKPDLSVVQGEPSPGPSQP